MMPFAVVGSAMGPVARWLGGADLTMVVGLPVAAGVYLLACRSLDLGAELRVVDTADAGLDPDTAATGAALHHV